MDIHHDLQTPREGQPDPTPNDSTPIFEMVIGAALRSGATGGADEL
jgi:hypothetical protein